MKQMEQMSGYLEELMHSLKVKEELLEDRKQTKIVKKRCDHDLKINQLHIELDHTTKQIRALEAKMAPYTSGEKESFITQYQQQH